MEVGWVAIHFENCGLLVKRFTDPIRISITRLGDYNIISIHQLDNIDGLLSLPRSLIDRSVIRYFLHETPRLIPPFSPPSDNFSILEFIWSYDAKIKVAIRSFRGISKSKVIGAFEEIFSQITISRASRPFVGYLKLCTRSFQRNVPVIYDNGRFATIYVSIYTIDNN